MKTSEKSPTVADSFHMMRGDALSKHTKELTGQQLPLRKYARQNSDGMVITENTKRPTLHLKGEMKFVAAWNKILFVCNPV